MRTPSIGECFAELGKILVRIEGEQMRQSAALLAICNRLEIGPDKITEIWETMRLNRLYEDEHGPS